MGLLKVRDKECALREELFLRANASGKIFKKL